MKTSTIRYSTILEIALLLTGCASPLPVEKTQLEHSASCCDSYSSFHYQSLPIGKPVKSKLSSSSPVFDFPEGKSYFAAYVIAGSFSGGTVYVAGYGGGFSESDATWFYPAITVLDAAFRPIGYSDEGTPIHSGNYWHGETMIENRLLNVSGQAKYVIVHFPARARNGHIGGSLHQKNSVDVVKGKAVPGGGNEVTINVPLAPVGEFKIAVLSGEKTSPDDLPRNTFWYHITGLKPK